MGSKPVGDRETIKTYEQEAAAWTDQREALSLAEVRWVAARRVEGPVIDIGCGPGWHLRELTRAGGMVVGLDAARAMLDLATQRESATELVHAGADALPFRSQSLGGAVASRVYQHLPATSIPLGLADLHRCLRVDAPVFVHIFGGDRSSPRRSNKGFAGRLFSGFSADEFEDLLIGAGFTIAESRIHDNDLRFLVRRALTLPDTVGPNMSILLCGLNPSVYSAEVGVGFGRPGNRFWPAALAAGLLSKDRDPFHALAAHGVGMTDLVKRATPRAADLSTDEFHNGFGRLDRLVEWLKPGVVCFVGLTGWRHAVNRQAKAGLQERTVGGRPVYLMPSTSGLNASTQHQGFVEHFNELRSLAGEA